jgi:hypothetical protein
MECMAGDATIFQFIIPTSVYSTTCFGRFPAHQELSDCSGSLWFYLRIVVIVVLCSWSGRPAVHSTRLLFSGQSVHARLLPATHKQKHMGAHAQPF